MISQKDLTDLTNEIIDEAMGQILSGVNNASVLRVLMLKYKNPPRALKDLLDIANEDAMSYMKDMHNYSRCTDEAYCSQYESDPRV